MSNIMRKSSADGVPEAHQLAAFLDGFSMEVTPRTAAKIADFKGLLPNGSRIYIAHIEGTPIEDMVATAKRLHREGFRVMPHLPARIIKDVPMLEDWIVATLTMQASRRLCFWPAVSRIHMAFSRVPCS